jgi:riboflavin biosynthesis pyrimidine reductase
MTTANEIAVVTGAGAPGLAEPLQVLYETEDLAADPLPEALQVWYGGSIRFPRPRLVANFVASIDGVVAISGLTQSNKVISAGSEADRFVMGLLRAFADVVLIGSGTLHGSPGTLWTARHAYPPGGRAFEELRQRHGQPAAPQLAVMTGSGAIDVSHPAIQAGAVVLTTQRGASALRKRLPDSCDLVVLPGAHRVDPPSAVKSLTRRGHRLILSEAGPHVFGALLTAGLVDELFLTQSPMLAGRSAHSPRPGLVEGTELLPDTRRPGRLASARRHGDHLLLRYTFDAEREPR